MGRIVQFDCPFCDKFFTDKPHMKFHVQGEHMNPGVTAANSNTAVVTEATTAGKISRDEIESLLPATTKSISSRSQGDLKALGLWFRESIKVLAESNKPFKTCSCKKEVRETCSHPWLPASKGIDANAAQFNSLFVAQWSTLIPQGKTDRESKLHQIAYIRALATYLQEQKLIAVVPKRIGTRGTVWYYRYEDKPQTMQTRSQSETKGILDIIAVRVEAALKAAEES